MTAKILPLNTYDVYEFPWGSAVKDWRRDKWLTIHISESEVDVENIRVRLHDNGIEFL